MYKQVEGSHGKAPRFVITVGLQEGYGPTAKIHTVDEVTELVLSHLKGCASNSQPFLTGAVSTGKLVYAWLEAPGQAGGGHESQACYSGNINPLYNSSMSCEAIEEFLNGLASRLGETLGQTRVYVEFDGELWILQKEDSETPTGETA